MDPITMSAQFAAYTWFESCHVGKHGVDDAAVRFAKKNWLAFLPCAHEGLGRLLIRIAGKRAQRCRTGRRIPRRTPDRRDQRDRAEALSA